MRIVPLLLLLFSLLYAEHDEHREHHFPMDIGYLELTDAQHGQVERIVHDYREARHRYSRHKKELRESFETLFTAGTFDRERFLAMKSELSEEASAAQAAFFADIHKVLTPEQRRRFARYMQEWEVE